MWPKWPIILLLFLVPPGILGESPGDTTPSDEAVFDGSTSPSTTPSPKLEEEETSTSRDYLRKAARVEPMSEGSEQKRGDDEHYDVIDVMAATGAAGTGAGSGRPKSGQTTRIYTTGEVDESFWLKHLGDDFKHAIHLQVGGTNEEYNRLINQTQNGVHEEVHHEYLPGAERPDGEVVPSPSPPSRMPSGGGGGGYFRANQQQSFDSRSLAMKQQYLIQQQAQQQQRQQQQRQQQQYNYALQHRQLYTPLTQSQQHRHQQQQHTQHPQQQQHRHQQQQQQQHQYPETLQHSHIRYQKPQKHGYIINSSEDQLHASQSNSAPVRSGGPVGYEEEGDSFNSQLNFKSPFNDYGSRPTRDLTYLLYRRGL